VFAKSTEELGVSCYLPGLRRIGVIWLEIVLSIPTKIYEHQISN
jgi:hypothetical protein